MIKFIITNFSPPAQSGLSVVEQEEEEEVEVEGNIQNIFSRPRDGDE